MEPQQQTPQSQQIGPQPSTEAPQTMPGTEQRIKKHGKFWLIAPASSLTAGLFAAMLGRFVTVEAVHTLLNVIAYILIGFGALAFIPGLLYGFVLVKKK